MVSMHYQAARADFRDAWSVEMQARFGLWKCRLGFDSVLSVLRQIVRELTNERGSASLR